jgi:hypothetical protein
MIPKINNDYFPRGITWPILVMQTQYVFYDVETDFYNIICMKLRLERFTAEEKKDNLKIPNALFGDMVFFMYPSTQQF